MIGAVLKHINVSSIVGLLAGSVLLGMMAIQYPLATTFPIGGDATRYILDLLEVKSLVTEGQLFQAGRAFFTNTSYPGAQIILGTSALLPISWPERFTWWMSLGHFVSGLAIGYFAWRLADWKAAAVGMAIWALTFAAVLPDVESGTLAQLWSLPPLIIFLERFMSRSWWGASIAAIITTATHPISGALVLLVLVVSLPTLILYSSLRMRRFNSLYIVMGFCLIVLIGWGSRFVIKNIHTVLTVDLPVETSQSITNLIYTPFGLFLLLAPVGIIVLIRQKTAHKLGPFFTFTTLGLLLAFNDRLGAGFYPERFLSYPIISATLLSGTALPVLVRAAIPHPLPRWLFAILVIVSSALFSWNENVRVFAFYESESKYARLHPQERAAIEWLAEHTPPDAMVVSTNVNRHSEWIPILSGRKWRPLRGEERLWHLRGDELQAYVEESSYTHLVLFKHREKPSDVFPISNAAYPVVFENKGAMIIQLKPL